MCQSKSSWWIPGDRIFDNLREVNIKIEYFPVKFCINCDRVWEKPLKFSEVRRTDKSYVVFHKDFPTYGLKRETCYACIERRKDRTYKSRRKTRNKSK